MSIATKYCRQSVHCLVVTPDQVATLMITFWAKKFFAVTFQIVETTPHPSPSENSRHIWCTFKNSSIIFLQMLMLNENNVFCIRREHSFIGFCNCFLGLIQSFTTLLKSLLRLTFTFGCRYYLLSCTKWSRTAATLHLPAMCFHGMHCQRRSICYSPK